MAVAVVARPSRRPSLRRAAEAAGPEGCGSGPAAAATDRAWAPPRGLGARVPVWRMAARSGWGGAADRGLNMDSSDSGRALGDAEAEAPSRGSGLGDRGVGPAQLD